MAHSRAVIALGGNVGNRYESLMSALRSFGDLGIRIECLSRLYETAPAYVTDQPPFLNAAAVVQTSLPPHQLLSKLKSLEERMGRDLVGGLRNGPRPLDLDIIFYGETKMATERLEIPHPRWRERDFVLAPLSDLCVHVDALREELSRRESVGRSSSVENGPDDPWNLRPEGEEVDASPDASSLPFPTGPLTLSPPPKAADALDAHLREAHAAWEAAGGERRVNRPGLETVLPWPLRRSTDHATDPTLLWRWGERSRVLGVINVTPDSFSSPPDRAWTPEACAAEAVQLVAQGAEALDVGAQSTRPGSRRVSPREELARLLPALRAIRSAPGLADVPVSVDTYSAAVARVALASGLADAVNDVTGGLADAGMLPELAAASHAPVVLMHMRGQPSCMRDPELCDYEPEGGLFRGVGAELSARAAAALAAGVPPWNLVLDPGMGFAKTSQASLDLAAQLPRLRSEGLSSFARRLPLALGPGRKSCLSLLAPDATPQERDAATAALSGVAVAGGARLVRVHDAGLVRQRLDAADQLGKEERDAWQPPALM